RGDGARVRGRAGAAVRRRRLRPGAFEPVPAMVRGPGPGAGRVRPRAAARWPAAVLDLRPGHAEGVARRVRRSRRPAARQPLRRHARHRRRAAGDRIPRSGAGARRLHADLCRSRRADARPQGDRRDQRGHAAPAHADRSRAPARGGDRVRTPARRRRAAGHLRGRLRGGARAGTGPAAAPRRRGRRELPGRRAARQPAHAQMSAIRPPSALAAVLLALASALFFTATYVLNRAMANDGGHWAWAAALRYLLTLPMLALVLLRRRGGFAPVTAALRAHPWTWLAWSSLGFGLFCVLLTWAAAFAPAWLVAGTFQLTVIAGMLLGPLLYRDERARLPRLALALGGVIVLGVALMQGAHFHGRFDREAWLALVAVALSAFLYPLGNRAILLHLERSGERLDATQRVFGMTLASQPLWLLVAAHAALQAGPPTLAQVWLAAGVALSAGAIATILFFQATGLVRDQPPALAAAEA